MPPLHTADESEESRDFQHHHTNHHNVRNVHIHHLGSSGHHFHHGRSHFPSSFVDEINHAFIPYGSNIGVSNSNGTIGTGKPLLITGGTAGGLTEREYDAIVIGALFTPLVLAVFGILIIAAIVRRMRRPTRTQSTERPKSLAINEPETPHSFETVTSPSKSDALSMTLSEPAALPSFYQNRSAATSPSENPQSYLPPWFLLHSSSVFRSQHYHQNTSNKLYSHFNHSMFNLSYLPSHQKSVDDLIVGQPINNRLETCDEQIENDGNSNSSNSDYTVVPARPNKKLKRVFSMLNLPKKIRKIQADKNRFNVYTIPIETREQLKQIYVY